MKGFEGKWFAILGLIISIIALGLIVTGFLMIFSTPFF